MLEKRRVDYKWVMIVICFLMVMIALGFGNSTKSLFPDEIAKDLGVERSLVSIGESCRYIATAVTNLFFSFLIIKFGPKKLVCVGFVSLASAALIYSFAETLLPIYIAGTLLGIGFSFTTTTMVGYIVGIWYTKNKGTIMGFILASSGLGGAIAIRIVGNLIDPTVIGSYRSAYRLMATVFAVTLIGILLFFRSRPKSTEQETDATPQKSAKKRGRDWVGIEFSQAVRKSYFWGIVLCIFFSGLILQGINGIAAMHFKDVGIDYDRVKSLLSFGALILAGAKFSTGFVYDRFGLRTTASICTFFAIAATFLLAFVKGNEIGFTLAILYAISAQMSFPLETIMLPIYASDLFGKKSYSKIMGLFVSVNTAGYAVGAPLMNLCYDQLGSYVPALLLVSCMMCGIFVLLQFVITAAHKDQKRLLETLEETPQEETI